MELLVREPRECLPRLEDAQQRQRRQREADGHLRCRPPPDHAHERDDRCQEDGPRVP